MSPKWLHGGFDRQEGGIPTFKERPGQPDSVARILHGHCAFRAMKEKRKPDAPESVHCGPRYSWTTDEEGKEYTQALGGTLLGKLTLAGNPDSANQTSGGGLIPLLPYEGCGKYAS